MALAASAAGLACGCAPPPARTIGPSIERGGGLLIAPDSGEVAYNPAESWDPRFGRMGPYLRNRHAEAADFLASDRSPETLWSEHFDAFRPEDPVPWKKIGTPILRLLPEAGRGHYLQLEAPPDGATHGLQREVTADDVRGQVVRVRIVTRQTSAARARVLGTPRMRWLVATADERERIAPLPIVGRASPGWEEQESVAFFDASVRRVWLQIVHTNSNAPFDLDDVLVERLPADMFSWSAAPDASAASAAAAPNTLPTTANLVCNGNFEVGPKAFSVWSERQWPGRGSYPAAQPWYFDSDAMVGQTSLEIPVAGAAGGVTLGPFDPARPHQQEGLAERYHLSFYAKASVPGEVEVDWRVAGLASRRERFRIGTEWARHRHVFLGPAAMLRAPGPVPTELVFRLLPTATGAQVTYWLDGVSLGAIRVAESFAPPTPVEIGIFGPAPSPTDLGELLQLGEPAAFAMRLVNYRDRPFTGTIALDLVDAYDRPRWTKTIQTPVAPESTWNDQIVLRLPRGYYRMKATAWSESIGTSTILSRDERATAVIDLADAVPRTGFFGLAADAGALSARTTQIGTGWVALPLDAAWCAGPRGLFSFAGWLDAIERCPAQDLRVAVRLSGLPRDAALRRSFYRAWVEAGGECVTAVHVDGRDVESREILATTRAGARPLASLREWLGVTPEQEPALLLGASMEDLPATRPGPATRPVASQATTATSGPADGFAFRCLAPAMMPEDAESQLDQWAQRRVLWPATRWWDMSVTGCAGSAYADRLHIATDPATPIRVQTSRPDPLLSASCLVRGMMIRHIAGVDSACSSVQTFRASDSLLDAPADRLNEYDNAPRPALAAWDWMTVLLNDAEPIEWFDKPSDVRGVAFARADGQVVLALWRPFGRTAQRLILKGLAGRAVVYDLFGQPASEGGAGNDLVVRIDSIVRYVVVAASHRESLLAAIAAAEPTTP